MNPRRALNEKRERRKHRNRARIFGTAERPRLAIFRSNRFMYAQLVDDEKGRTLIHASSREVTAAKGKGKADRAARVGALVAERALELKIKKAVCDRRAYRYHGRVKAVVEGARKAGLRV